MVGRRLLACSSKIMDRRTNEEEKLSFERCLVHCGCVRFEVALEAHISRTDRYRPAYLARQKVLTTDIVAGGLRDAKLDGHRPGDREQDWADVQGWIAAMERERFAAEWVVRRADRARLPRGALQRA
jgi:hypothetical protein